MPRPGGATDKVGNRYEAAWTINAIARVLAEEARAIRLEPPSQEGDGVEFWLDTEEGREYHQVKRQTFSGTWTLAKLSNEQVLANIKVHLQSDERHTFTFVSTISAHELSELAERASDAADFQEFKSGFLAAKKWKNKFDELRRIWDDIDDELAFSYLTRIRIVTIDEKMLRDVIRLRLETLLSGDPGAASSWLFQFSFESLHQILTADLLWNALHSIGIHPRALGNDSRNYPAIQQANQRIRDSYSNRLILGATLERPEVQSIVEALDSSEGPKMVVLTGKAGVGKSGIIYRLSEELSSKRMPYLIVRMDQVREALTATALGEELELLSSPVAALDAAAYQMPSVLIIDQLDAVSLASGRRPHLFQAAEELLNQVSSRPLMKVIVCCRLFDLRNDSRLQKLYDGAFLIEVQPLTRDQVSNVLETVGVNPRDLSEVQFGILTNPLNLSMFAEVHNGNDGDTGFQSEQQLFDLYWERKQGQIRERLDAPFNWTPVFDRLCDLMSAQQRLWVPEAVLDDLRTETGILESEGVLSSDQQRVSFFHESFFDYAFARRHVGRGKDLIATLVEVEQGIFRRAQVRQILTYMRRQPDSQPYLLAVSGLLHHAQIRSHIRETVFASLSDLADPWIEEWQIIAPFMEQYPSSSYQKWRSFEVIGSSAAWFDIADQHGRLTSWLSGFDEGAIDASIRILRKVLDSRADRVAELLSPHVGKWGFWTARFEHILFSRDPWESRAFVDLALKAIQHGSLDDVGKQRHGNVDFWSIARCCVDVRPDWACELISAYLLRRLEIAVSLNKNSPFSIGENLAIDGDPEVLDKCATATPKAFLSALMPAMITLIESASIPGEDVPILDEIWQWRYLSDHPTVSEALLESMARVFEWLASKEPVSFLQVSRRYADSGLETVQYLLLRGFGAADPEIADHAIDFLTSRAYRFQIGNMMDEYGLSCELVRSASGRCSIDRFEQLQKSMLEFAPRGSDKKNKHKDCDHARWQLLRALDPSRRNNLVEKVLRELDRKFTGQPDPVPAMKSYGGFVRSPIADKAAEKLSDEQWLKAMEKYDGKDMGPARRDHLIGGAPELAQQFRRFVREDPERFVKLGMRIPLTARHEYFAAVLDGLSELDDLTADVERTIEFCVRCHSLTDRPLARSLCFLLAKMPPNTVDQRIIEMLEWYATQSTDPSQELWKADASGTVYYGGDPESAGLNSDRGAAAFAIGRLINADSNLSKVFLPVVEAMVMERSTAVRAQVAGVLLELLFVDRDYAVQQFLKLCAGQDELLGTRSVERFLNFAIATHFEDLGDLLERMIRSEHEAVAVAGARQSVIAALTKSQAEHLLELCINGDEQLRVGAAQVLSANVSESGLTEACLQGAQRLFDDEEETVRTEASKIFNNLEPRNIRNYDKLIQAFVESEAFEGSPESLFDFLLTATDELPELTVAAVARFLYVERKRVGDIRYSAAGISEDVATLLVRTYANSPEPTIRELALDSIDTMTELKAYGLEGVLGEFGR